MSKAINRRHFIKACGIGSSAAWAGYKISHPKVSRAGGFIRRDIGELSASDPIIMSYRKAIKAMQALPYTNPLSWEYQAAIHGTMRTDALLAWNTCQHTDMLFFWSWHRMYLYWFERIIRKMSADSGWALPYWDWSSPLERQLPAAFRDPASELYTPHRVGAINDGTGFLPFSDVTYTTAFSHIDFLSASTDLNSTPHSSVHVKIGGWMGNVSTAALDPIFYLHHCQIDRLWNLWLSQGGGRTDPLAYSTFRTRPFYFFDENGRTVTMTGCDVLRASQQLGYTYELEPAQVEQFCLTGIPITLGLKVASLIDLQLPSIVLTSQTVFISVDRQLQQLQPTISSILANPTLQLLLKLDGIEADSQPGVSWEVYFGLPPNVQPSANSPFYVGKVVLFGSGIHDQAMHHGFTPAEFQFVVNGAAIAAVKANSRPSITFVPSGININGRPGQPDVKVPVRIGKVSLALGVIQQVPSQ